MIKGASLTRKGFINGDIKRNESEELFYIGLKISIFLKIKATLLE